MTTLFAALRGAALTIRRIPLNDAVHGALENMFVQQNVEFDRGIDEIIDFTGDWKPDEDELLRMPTPQSAHPIVEAIEGNAVATPLITAAELEGGAIKALFVGVERGGVSDILIQKFTRSQIIDRRKFLFLQEQRFTQIDNTGFSLKDRLAGRIVDGSLQFKSFNDIKSIFDLGDFYREATRDERNTFVGHELFAPVDLVAFERLNNQTISRLIHLASSMGVLGRVDAAQLQAHGQRTGLAVNVADGRVVLPTTTRDLKELLQLLTDRRYVAPISEQTYVANSVRRIGQ
jgi:hypothetical protein